MVRLVFNWWTRVYFTRYPTIRERNINPAKVGSKLGRQNKEVLRMQLSQQKPDVHAGVQATMCSQGRRFWRIQK